MLNPFVLQQTYTIITCANCGIDFAISESFVERLKKSHDSFYCPHGHSQHFVSKSDEDKLKEEVERLKNRIRIEQEYKEDYRNQRDEARRSAIAHKGHKTRLKKRIANGVCPCCNRHFSNLGDHMKSEHPDFVNED